MYGIFYEGSKKIAARVKYINSVNILQSVVTIKIKLIA